jgi:hypothetical protein
MPCAATWFVQRLTATYERSYGISLKVYLINSNIMRVTCILLKIQRWSFPVSCVPSYSLIRSQEYQLNEMNILFSFFLFFPCSMILLHVGDLRPDVHTQRHSPDRWIFRALCLSLQEKYLNSVQFLSQPFVANVYVRCRLLPSCCIDWWISDLLFLFSEQ